MTACMLLGALFTVPRVFFGVQPGKLTKLYQVVGGILMLAGAWNVFWHGLRHLSDFWGQAGIASGVFMLICGLYLCRESALTPFMRRLMPIATIALTGWALYYAYTIYNL